MREFKFEEKETFTLDEMKALLEQHTKFVSNGYDGYIKPEDHAKLVEELQPYKVKARETKLSELTKGLTSSDKIKDAISLASLKEDDDDDTIVSKVKEVIEARPYLQGEVEEDITTLKTSIKDIDKELTPKEVKKPSVYSRETTLKK